MSEIFGDNNNNHLIGTGAADHILGLGGNDTLLGLGGDDSLEGGEDNDSLQGGIGNDQLFGDKGNDFLYGEDNSDVLVDSYGTNILDGGSGSDTLSGGELNILLGGEDNDTYLFSGDAPIGSNIIEETSGIDTIKFAFSTKSIKLDLGITTTQIVTANLTLSLSNANQIENVIGSYDSDSIKGNALSNVLQGGDINDALYGANTNLLDNDHLDGKDGNDTLLGWYGNDTLIGGVGNDILDGGVGGDSLNGGDGNDTYYVDKNNDKITETSTLATEIDTVHSSVTYSLAANVENLILTGSAINGSGNGGNNSLTGNNLNNSLNGNSGSDTLNGGSGSDTLNGGSSNDTYYVDNSADLVKEFTVSTTEIDTVYASINYALTDKVENLILTGTAINGTGNALHNSLEGNNLNNTLSGGEGNDTLNAGKGDDTLNGGTGNDTFNGGDGNDTYLLDNNSDLVTETSTSTTEIDTVHASVNYTLTANVEHLILKGFAFNGVGNHLNNLLVGNSNHNSLEGGAGDDYLEDSVGNDYLDGGTGNDTLSGGINSDTYIVDSIGDVVIEPGFAEAPNPFPDEMAISSIIPEFDQVFASVNYFLAENLEALFFTGTANLSGSGNYLNNTLVGANGNDTLNGAGGNDILNGRAGNDILIGGDAASDRFVFSGDAPFTRPSKTEIIDPALGVDRIEDFDDADYIEIDKTVFSSLNSNPGFGFSEANEFAVVSRDIEVATSQALIVYSKETGNLFYNQNSTNSDLGSGGIFATLVNTPDLTPGDFVITI